MPDDPSPPPPAASPPLISADTFAAAVPELASSPLPKAREITGAPAARVQNSAVMSAWMEHDVKTREAARLEAEAEQDREKALIDTAKQTSSDAGVQYENDLGQAGSHPIVVVQVLYRNGTHERFMECDLVMAQGEETLSMTLCMICPRCHERGLPAAQCQIKIDDRNKRFHLDESTKGTPWKDPDTGEFRILAGTVDVSEICKCDRPGCGFKFRISPHGPVVGVGRLIPE